MDIVRSIIVQEDGSLVQELGEAPPGYAPPAQDRLNADRWVVVRRQRDSLLAASDWVPLRAMERGEPMPQAWVDYRQALRDLTNSADPFQVVFPTPPA